MFGDGFASDPQPVGQILVGEGQIENESIISGVAEFLSQVLKESQELIRLFFLAFDFKSTN